MEDEEKGYNGWKNYETWDVALWIDNDRSSYEWARDMARTIMRQDAPTAAQVEDNIWTVAQAERFMLADALKDWIEQDTPEMEASLYSDLLASALGEVDWYEIAENYLSELAEVQG